MAYATRTDMAARFGTGEVERLATDSYDDSIDRTVAALADADAVIDAYISVSYTLPLARDVIWPLLRDIACDMARADLYDDAPLEAPQERMSRGIRKLEKLRDGKMNLVDATGNVAPRKNVAVRTGPDPRLSAANLKGF